VTWDLVYSDSEKSELEDALIELLTQVDTIVYEMELYESEVRPDDTQDWARRLQTAATAAARPLN
jgi:hypothetical protein